MTDADVERLSTRMSRNGVALEFLSRRFEGPPEGFRAAEELNLVPIGERLGQRVAIYDRGELVVLPVRGKGVLVAAARFEGSFERHHVWPKILASIRMRDEAGLERSD